MCASPLLRSSLLALTLSEVQRIYFFEICLSLSLALLHHFLMIALKMNNIAARSSPVPRPSVRPSGGGAVVVVFDITYVLLSLQPPPPPPPLLVLLE